jgi:hypothetical protein
MEKLIFLVWGDGRAASGDALRQTLLDDAAGALVDAGARGITVNVHDSQAAEAPSPAPAPGGEQPHVAQVSVWVDSYDRQGPPVASTIARAAGAERTVAGYLVTESLYDDYGTTPHAQPRDWADGERSPGVLTVALIHRPEGLAYDEWIRRWHGTQSPESGQLQPRTRYVRNEVVRPVTDGAPEVHGIVEEAWPSAAHVKDQMLFFNATTADELNANVQRMLENVNACLDLGRLRSATMSEHFVRTPGGHR